MRKKCINSGVVGIVGEFRSYRYAIGPSSSRPRAREVVVCEATHSDGMLMDDRQEQKGLALLFVLATQALGSSPLSDEIMELCARD